MAVKLLILIILNSGCSVLPLAVFTDGPDFVHTVSPPPLEYAVIFVE